MQPSLFEELVHDIKTSWSASRSAEPSLRHRRPRYPAPPLPRTTSNGSCVGGIVLGALPKAFHSSTHNAPTGRAFPRQRKDPPTGRTATPCSLHAATDTTSDRVAERLRAGPANLGRAALRRTARLRAGGTVAGVPAGRAAGLRASGLAGLMTAGGILHLLLAEVGDGTPSQFKSRLPATAGLGRPPSRFRLRNLHEKPSLGVVSLGKRSGAVGRSREAARTLTRPGDGQKMMAGN